jgi:hypothetical protein
LEVTITWGGLILGYCATAKVGMQAIPNRVTIIEQTVEKTGRLMKKVEIDMDFFPRCQFTNYESKINNLMIIVGWVARGQNPTNR